MKFEELDIPGVFKIKPNILNDERGTFFRYYCKKEFEPYTKSEFVQMNHSINNKKWTLRGMHYQVPPNAEEKLIRCVKGEIYDVYLDLRADSVTFLKWGAILLSDKNKEMLFLPKGIAHGFMTLEDDTHVLYQHTQYYSPESEKGIAYNDPLIKIEWPHRPSTTSVRDSNHTFLSNSFKGLRYEM